MVVWVYFDSVKVNQNRSWMQATTRGRSLLSDSLFHSNVHFTLSDMILFVSPLGLVQCVRRWSPVQTPWSRPTARAANTASFSLTCCCSVAPVPTRRCSASAPVVTTWRDRWRCAKTAYSSITPPVVGGWINPQVASRSVCGFPHLSLGWRTHQSYLFFFPSCCIKLNVSEFQQQRQQRTSSHSGRSPASCVLVDCNISISCFSADSGQQRLKIPTVNLNMVLKLLRLSVELHWTDLHNTHTHTHKGWRKPSFTLKQTSLFWTKEQIWYVDI